MNPDVVIVGAGIVGSSIALELARRGLQVLVVEKEAVGGGSTGASSACIRQGYGREEAIRLARDGLKAWERWREHAEIPVGTPAARFRRTGAFYLMSDPEKLRAQAARMRSCGVPIEEWSRADAAARYPAWDLTGIAGAIFEPEGGYVDQPDLAAKNAMDAARARGASLHIDRVTGIERTGSRVAGVALARAGRVSCGCVINAAGPWSFLINRMAGVSVPLRPLRHRTILVPLGEPAPRDIPMVADLPGRIYFRSEPTQGGVLVGSLDEERDGEPIGDPDALDPRVDGAFYAEKNLAVAKRMPESVRFPSWVRGIAGAYDVHEPDWYPVFSRSEVDGYYLAVGTSGAWFKGGPSIGALMAHLVCESFRPFRFPRTGDECDPAFFRWDRPPITTSFAGGVIG